MSGWLDGDRPGSGAIEGDARQIDGQLQIYRNGEWRPLGKGDRIKLPQRKLDIRPAFTGESKASFKPARKKGRF